MYVFMLHLYAVCCIYNIQNIDLLFPFHSSPFIEFTGQPVGILVQRNRLCSMNVYFLVNNKTFNSFY